MSTGVKYVIPLDKLIAEADNLVDLSLVNERLLLKA